MRKYLLVLTLVFSVLFSKAQLTINDSLSTSDITTLLQGLGVTISSLTVNCPSGAIGKFNGTSEMSITQGLALSTGLVLSIADSNNIGSTSASFFFPGDSDLDSLSGITTYDGCILEFNAVPSADTLYFNYCFGSEEYPEFVFAGFNDPFAVLISGPGITGRINATTLPGGTAVTIDNVNDSVNSSYYYNNETPPGHYITYDGFTTNMMAFAQVIPDSTYHFKVAIADAGDDIFDSGVMLEAFSFRCVAAEPTFAGIHENRLSSLSVYPNPGNGNFYVNDKEHVLLDGMVRIVNVFGQDIFSEKITSELTEINISNQAAGIYFVSVITDNGIYKAKILKK